VFSGWMLVLLGKLLALSHCFSVLLYSLDASSGFSLEKLLHCGSGKLSVLSHCFSLLLYESGFSLESLLHF